MQGLVTWEAKGRDLQAEARAGPWGGGGRGRALAHGSGGRQSEKVGGVGLCGGV